MHLKASRCVQHIYSPCARIISLRASRVGKESRSGISIIEFLAQINGWHTHRELRVYIQYTQPRALTQWIRSLLCCGYAVWVLCVGLHSRGVTWNAFSIAENTPKQRRTYQRKRSDAKKKHRKSSRMPIIDSFRIAARCTAFAVSIYYIYKV